MLYWNEMGKVDIKISISVVYSFGELRKIFNFVSIDTRPANSVEKIKIGLYT